MVQFMRHLFASNIAISMQAVIDGLKDFRFWVFGSILYLTHEVYFARVYFWLFSVFLVAASIQSLGCTTSLYSHLQSLGLCAACLFFGSLILYCGVWVLIAVLLRCPENTFLLLLPWAGAIITKRLLSLACFLKLDCILRSFLHLSWCTGCGLLLRLQQYLISNRYLVCMVFLEFCLIDANEKWVNYSCELIYLCFQLWGL